MASTVRDKYTLAAEKACYGDDANWISGRHGIDTESLAQQPVLQTGTAHARFSHPLLGKASAVLRVGMEEFGETRPSGVG